MINASILNSASKEAQSKYQLNYQDIRWRAG